MMLDLPAILASLNPLNTLTPFDVALLVLLFLYGLDGIRRGLIAGILGLAGIVATVYVAILAIQPATDLWHQLFPSGPFSGPLPPIVAFFLALALAQFVFGFVRRFILSMLNPLLGQLGPLTGIERALGFFPGVAQGLLIFALIVIPLYLLAVIQPLNAAVDQSVIVGELTRQVSAWNWSLDSLLGRTAAVEIPLRSHVLQPGENVRVPHTTALELDAQAETKMLQLLNRDRINASLRPLVADEGLRQVARRHSQEMFELGYFSHTSPTTGTPGDRLQGRGITFTMAGENLAYAPTVEVAHAGLMASRGHRRNILAPEFTRVGIGVMRGRWVGRMFTQNFAS